MHAPSGQPCPDHVWYAAYGSNLDRSRFECYVAGGRPSGATRTYPGCRDTSPPSSEAPARIPNRLYFAGESTVWSGAVAFVETAPSAPAGTETLVRLYRITWEQFVDVHAQDNWSGTQSRGLPTLSVLRSQRVMTVGSGWYDTLVHLGDREEEPVITFTSCGPATIGDLAPPADAYVETMAKGLSESHGLCASEIAAYVAAAPGAAGCVVPDDLEGAISRVR